MENEKGKSVVVKSSGLNEVFTHSPKVSEPFSFVKSAPTVELCQCELSGDFHIIINGKCCELCDKDRMAFTPENVEKAFQFYRKKVTEALTRPRDAVTGVEDREAELMQDAPIQTA